MKATTPRPAKRQYHRKARQPQQNVLVDALFHTDGEVFFMAEARCAFCRRDAFSSSDAPPAFVRLPDGRYAAVCGRCRIGPLSVLGQMNISIGQVLENLENVYTDAADQAEQDSTI